MREGFAIGGGLILAGLMLELSAGAVVWDAFAWPVNGIVLAAFLLIILVCFMLRRKVYAFRFLSSYGAAIPALVYAVVLTTVMGLTKQVPAAQSHIGAFPFSRMLSFWPFVLIYVWIAFILGLVILKRLSSFRWKDIPFLFNHLGLFVVMTAATLGNADMQRLKMTVIPDSPEWRAVDDNGMAHELPVAIQLERFTIDEYPPKLVLVDNESGNPVSEKQAEPLLIDGTFTEGRLGDWLIQLRQRLDYAVPVMKEDTTYYEGWMQKGAVSAVLVTATLQSAANNQQKPLQVTGWVSCGSYMFPYQLLKLDAKTSIAMPQREPQRYISRVEILTKTNKNIKTDILVNKPFSIDGWKIYQLNYDTTKGRWSEYSVLELVSDPWLPVVYAGIAMMLLGALCMFFMSSRKTTLSNT